jgi:hypothetical protein
MQMSGPTCQLRRACSVGAFDDHRRGDNAITNFVDRYVTFVLDLTSRKGILPLQISALTA